MGFEKMQRYEEECYDCGKPLLPTRKRKWMVNYNNSAGRVILPDATPEGDDWGLLPIGSECAKKLPKEYLIDGTTLPDLPNASSRRNSLIEKAPRFVLQTRRGARVTHPTERLVTMTMLPHPTPLYYATCGGYEGIAVQLGPLQYFMPTIQHGVYVVPLYRTIRVRSAVLEPHRTHLAEEFAKRLCQITGGRNDDVNPTTPSLHGSPPCPAG